MPLLADPTTEAEEMNRCMYGKKNGQARRSSGFVQKMFGLRETEGTQH